ncbi:MAG: DMT family transporter [Pseudomonadota bacterium]
MMINRLTPLVLILGVAWGLNFSLIKVAALSGMAYPLIAGATIIGNMLIFALFCRAFLDHIRIAVRFWLFFAACGGVGYELPFFLELFSVARIGAGTQALVVALAPIMTLVLSGLFRTETITWRRSAGIFLGFLAIVPLAAGEAGTLKSVFGVGLAVAIIVPFTYAIYHVLIDRYWPSDMEAFEVALGESLAAALMMGPIYAVWFQSDPVSEVVASSAYVAIGALLVFSALEVWLYFHIMRQGGALFVSQAGYVAVMAGIAWGAIFFGERVSGWIELSCVLMLCALILVTPKAKDTHGDVDASPTDA